MERLVDLAQKRPRDNEFQYDATGSRPGKVGRPAGSLETMAGVSGDDSVSATADLLLGNSASSGSTLGSGGLFSTFNSAPPSWNMPMNFMSEMPTPLPPQQSMPPPAAPQCSLGGSLSHSHLPVSASANPGGSNLALGPSGGGMDRNGGGTIGAPMAGPHSVPKRAPPNFAVPILESSRVVKLPPPQGKKAPLQLVVGDKIGGANSPSGGKNAGAMGGRGDKDRQNGAGSGGKLGPENGAGDSSGKEKGGGENMKVEGSETNKNLLGNLKERQAAAGGFRPPARSGRRGRPPGSGRKQAAAKAAASATAAGANVNSYALPETRTYVLPDSPPASSYEPDPIGAPVASTSERRRKKSLDTDSQIGQLAGENIRLWEALTKTVGELAMQRDMLWRLQAEVLALRVRLDAVSTSPYSWGGPPFIGQGGGSAPPTTTSGGPSWLRPDTAKPTGTNAGPSTGDGANPDGAKMGGRPEISIGKNGTGGAAFAAAAGAVENDYTQTDHRNLAQGNAGMQECEPTSMEALQSESGKKSVREMHEMKDSDTQDRGMGMGSGVMEEAKKDMDSVQAGAAAAAEGMCTGGGRTESDALEQSCLGGGTGSEIAGVECAAAEELVCDEGHMQEKGGDGARFKETKAVSEAGVCRGMEERDMLERHMLEVGSNNSSGASFEHDKEVRYNRIPQWSKEPDNSARLGQDNSPTMDRGGSQLGLELGMNKMGVQQEVNVPGKQYQGDGRMADSSDEDDGNRRNEGGRDVFHVDGRDMGGVESDGMAELPRELFNVEKDGVNMQNEQRSEGRMVQSGHEGCHGGGLDGAAEDNVSNRGMRSEDKEGAHGRVQIGPGLELLRNLPQRRAGQEVNEEIERGGNMQQQYRMMGVLGDASNTPIPGHSDSSTGMPTGVSSDGSQQMERGGRSIPMDGFSGLFSWNK